MRTSSRSDPWYLDGLRFGCRRCGACCTGDPGFVFLRHGEAAAIAAHLNLETGRFLGNFTRKAGARRSILEEADGRCVFLSPEGCRIYRVRPRQCLSFPFWGRNLSSRSSWKEAARDCPGMGRGRLFSREEIEKLR